MNVSELSSVLHEQAGEVDRAGLLPQLPQVRVRVRQARRRRAARWLVAGVVMLAGASMAVLRGHDDAPPEFLPSPHSAPGFKEVPGFEIVRTTVGRPGDNRITLTLPAPSGYAVAPVCRGSDTTLDTRLVVNGVQVGGTTCSADALGMPAFSGENLAANRVDTSRGRLIISLTLVDGRFDGRRARDARTVLALGVYRVVR